MRKVAVIFLALLVACGTPRSDDLRINIGSEPQTLDPRKGRELQSKVLAHMFFEGLTRVNREGKVVNALAEKIETSADGKIYTFHLRPARWSNGDLVIADDFVYAWKKVLDPTFPSDQAYQLYVIKNGKQAKEKKCPLDLVGVQALDLKTVQVELENPTTYFLELTAMPIFFPVPSRIDQSNPHWAEEASSYVSNGPFYLKEWKHSNHIKAVKNQTYWDAEQVKLNQIELVMVGEETEFKMHQRRELDWAGSPLSVLPIGALPSLKKSGQLHIQPFLATYFFRINIESPPFHHPLMRKAFALAINRRDIIDHVIGGEQIAATGLVPLEMGVQQRPYFKDGDVQGARECFKQALEGMSSPLPPVTLIYPASERNHLIAQTVQRQWYDILGVDVKLEAMERKIWIERVSKRNFQFSVGSWTADFNDPINFLDIFKLKNYGSNNTSWESDRYRELLDRAAQSSDRSERLSLFRECEAILMDEMPIIPVFYYTLLYVADARVKDVVFSNLGNVDFKWAYLAQGEEK